MPISLKQFVEQLSQSGILSAQEIQAYLANLPPGEHPPDGDMLAARLVQAGRLTRYQVAAVVQGKGKNLVFDEYVVLDKLGQGGMGVVLKARHRRMDRVVAIKVLPPATMKSPAAIDRFYREVKAAARLEHPNIVTAHDAREYQGKHYLVMQFVEGKDLAAIVREHGPLPIRQAVECIMQAARGLDYAHKHGVIHRDIKPANLLLDREGTVKILDMGLARVEQAAMEGPAGDRLTQSDQVMGTADYMAPEQALSTREADARSDIYSLGCTLYRLVTGKTPYKGETFTQLFLAHREAPIPSLRDARPEVPAELDRIFQKMIAKYAYERQQSMAEVIADLEGCLATRHGVADEEDSLSNGALAFLKEMTAGGTATRQAAEVKVEHTLDHNGHPETGTNIGLMGSLRRRKPRAIAVAVGAVVLLGLTAFGIVITIRGRDGRTTAIRVPDRSEVAIGRDGQVDVTLPPQFETPQGGFDPSQASSPLAPGTAQRSAGDGSDVRASSPFIGPDGNWKLTPGAPQPAVAPFDANKAKEHQAAWAKHLELPVEQTNSIGMKLALIPPGEFDMGSSTEEVAAELEQAKKDSEPQTYLDRVEGEGPRHRVKISRPFCLGVFEVTQAEYEKVMGVNPSAFTGKQMDASAFKPPLPESASTYRAGFGERVAGQDTSRHPVDTVSWNDGMEFLRRLSAMPAERAAGRSYRLPTEAEWEYACRAGTTTRWSCGDDEGVVEDYAWFTNNAGGMTRPVGKKRPNGWGLYDMHGNVYEWCADSYSKDYYATSPGTDPLGPAGGSRRVLRGGHWGNTARNCRSAYRHNGGPGDRGHAYGLRACAVPAEKPGE